MSQKLENLLNLALDADQGERERSEELDVGYDKEENVWELIVKYSGTLEAVRQTARSVTELLNGYAVIVIEEERIGQLAQLPEVEFIEKPKKLYFQTDVGRQVSCIDIVQDMPLSLRGKGTLIGIVDSGIDYENAEFRNEDGTTRIVSLWDQSVKWEASGRIFGRNRVYTGADRCGVSNRGQRGKAADGENIRCQWSWNSGGGNRGREWPGK